MSATIQNEDEINEKQERLRVSRAVGSMLSAFGLSDVSKSPIRKAFVDYLLSLKKQKQQSHQKLHLEDSFDYYTEFLKYFNGVVAEIDGAVGELDRVDQKLTIQELVSPAEDINKWQHKISENYTYRQFRTDFEKITTAVATQSADVFGNVASMKRIVAGLDEGRFKSTIDRKNELMAGRPWYQKASANFANAWRRIVQAADSPVMINGKRNGPLTFLKRALLVFPVIVGYLATAAVGAVAVGVGIFAYNGVIKGAAQAVTGRDASGQPASRLKGLAKFLGGLLGLGIMAYCPYAYIFASGIVAGGGVAFGLGFGVAIPVVASTVTTGVVVTGQSERFEKEMQKVKASPQPELTSSQVSVSESLIRERFINVDEKHRMITAKELSNAAVERKALKEPDGRKADGLDVTSQTAQTARPESGSTETSTPETPGSGGERGKPKKKPWGVYPPSLKE